MGQYLIFTMVLFSSIFTVHTSKSCMCCSTRLVLCATTTGRPTVSKYVKCSSRLPSSILNGAFSSMLLQKEHFHFISLMVKKKIGGYRFGFYMWSTKLLCMLYKLCMCNSKKKINLLIILTQRNFYSKKLFWSGISSFALILLLTH